MYNNDIYSSTSSIQSVPFNSSDKDNDQSLSSINDNVEALDVPQENIEIELIGQDNDRTAPPPPGHIPYPHLQPRPKSESEKSTLPKEGIRVCMMVPIANTVSVYGDKDPLLSKKRQSK